MAKDKNIIKKVVKKKVKVIKPPKSRIIYNKDTKEIKHALLKNKFTRSDFLKEQIDQELTKEDMKNYQIIKKVVKSKKTRLHIVVKVSIDISVETVIRYVKVHELLNKELFTPRTITHMINKAVKQYVDGIAGAIKYKILDTDIMSAFNEDDKFELKDMQLFKSKEVYDICNIFNEEINLNNNNLDCVRNYLMLTYHKLSIKNYVKNMNNGSAGISPRQLLDFAKKYRIFYKAFDINGNILCSHTENIDSKRKRLIICAYSSHMYILKNKFLHLHNPKNYNEVKLVKNGLDELNKFLNNKQVPSNIKISNYDMNKSTFQIRSFIINKIKYLHNDEYMKCLNILKKFGIEDKIYDTINLKNICSVIEKLYSQDKTGKQIYINSFMPECKRFINSGFNYHTKYPVHKKLQIQTDDKNKCYSSCLASLPFLIVLDYKKADIKKIIGLDRYKHNKKDYKFIDHYMYKVSPEKNEHNLLINKSYIYSGYYLNYCLNQNLKFNVSEEITTKKEFNYFKKMIEDVYNKVDNSTFKEMFNIFIGKFDKGDNLIDCYEFKKICDEQEANLTGGINIDINENLKMNIECKQKVILHTRKPIHNQILEQSRIQIYERIKKLKLNDDDIIQIKTDSITYYGKKPKDYDSKNLYGWKQDTYIKINPKPSYDNNESFIIPDKFNLNKNGIYGQAYAGAGKSYFIENILIPEIKKNNNTFLIVGASWDSVSPYVNKYNVTVIQKYEFHKYLIPDENSIIIDEHGLFRSCHWDIIYKWALLGKTIYSLGDTNQLLAFQENTS